MLRTFIFTLSAAVLPVLAWASTWEIDPVHSSAQFAVSHFMVSTVRGDFGKVSGTMNFDEKDPTKSSVEATIDANSINTRNEDRDKDLRSKTFFDVEAHPSIRFKSKTVEKQGDNTYRVTGELTIRGVTHEAVLEVTGTPKPMKDPWGNQRMGGVATTTINRKDFGMVSNSILDNGGVAIGETVEVTIDVELIEKK